MGIIFLLLVYKNKIKKGCVPFYCEIKSMKNLHPKIDVLLEAMQEQFAQIKQHQDSIPQIELDLLLSNLRKTYEFVCELNKSNKSDLTSSPAPVAVEKTTVQAPKESAFSIKNTSLPFEVPFFNKFKKESSEAASSAPAVTTVVKPNTGLKLESTTLPPFGPYVTIPKKEPLVEMPLTEISAELPVAVSGVEPIVEIPVSEAPFSENIVQEIPELKQITEPNDSATIIEIPVFEAAVVPEQVSAAPTEIPTPKFESLVFDLPMEPSDQEALTQAREKIFKEESKKQNPLKKIVDLFEDSIPGHEKFGESFSILDKFMKKKEDTSLVEKLRHTPIADLRTAVGVTEKFQFINELFGGNYEDYTASIELINKCKSFTDAEIFIAENVFDKYKWEVENRNVATFMDLVERRFL
jgi:hypothetical protein